ncbi:MAG: L-2-hydroxyglutarate oxidase [Chitinophagales bacterium]|nr:L-2-hydroxyglutarate oxidase [Chitinophagales bacterium]
MKYDVIIIGGGIVGLATALKILEKNADTKLAILEKEERIAVHQSGNNSGVIHSGVYYKPGSLRAINCIRGYQMLLDFCQRYDIPYEITGKIIVATRESQLESLQAVYEKGVANKLEGLKMIGLDEMREKEPHVNGIKAIWVPQAGIVDYRIVAEMYAELIKSAGGEIILDCKVNNIKKHSDHTEIHCSEDRVFTGKKVVNCAGLYSDKLAKLTHDKALEMKILPFRGEYYKLKKEKEYLVNALIYPAPDPAFPWLGVHYTRMAKGGVEAGPNAVLAFKREGYEFFDFKLNEFVETITYKGFLKMASKYWKIGIGEFYRSLSKSAFTKALQELIPEITEADLVKGGAGVRALACRDNGELVDDFIFYDDDRVINVCNAPSPAATSSLSIGDTVSNMVLKN